MLNNRKWLWLIIPALIALIAGVLFALSQKDSLPPGVTVGGVEVGKLSEAEARDLVERRVATPLQSKTIVIEAGDQKETVRVKDLKINVPVAAAVSQAQQKSNQGPFWSQGMRQLTGSNQQVKLAPQPNRKRIANQAKQLNQSFTHEAKDARISLSASGPKIKDGKEGSKVVGGQQAIESAIVAALAGDNKPLSVKAVDPKVSRDDLRKAPSIIVVKSKFKAYFYHGTKKVKSYDVAIGQSAYPTPEGLFAINGKQVNPVWSVPNSAWAGELAGSTIAGGTAANPLVARWMGITDGVGFHGTREEGSVGSAASHGCLRMRPSDIIEWYPKVPEGTPVLITG